MGRARRRPRLRGRLDRRHRRSAPRPRRPRAEARRARARRRVRRLVERASARSSTSRASRELAHAVGALCWVDAVQYAAHEPIDVQALGCDVLHRSRVQVLRPAPRRSPTAGTSCSSRGARTRRARRRIEPVGRTLRDRAPRRTSCSPASRRRSRTSSRSAAWRRSARTSASSGSASSTGCRTSATVYGAADDGRPRPDVPAQRRRRAAARRRDDDGRARLRRVGARQLVLARPAREAPVSRQDALRVGLIHYNTADEIDGFIAELALSS